MGDFDSKGSEPVEIDKVETIRAVQTYMRGVLGDNEMIKRNGLEGDVVEILCETQLPEKFPVAEIGSVKNDTTETKYEILYNTDGLLEAGMIPDFMTFKYPVSFEEDVLEKAPWVNMVHAWMKVLNYSNTLAAIQRGRIEDLPKVIAPIVEGLYKFTTESDGDFFSRTSKQFKNQEKFPETTMRESGTKGVNISRHVSMAEMKYVLMTMRKAFSKTSL